MKKYMFLSIGFEKPTPEIMGAWQQWFESMANRIVEQGGLWSGGQEITKDGTAELPLGLDSTTGYLIFNAASLDKGRRAGRSVPDRHQQPCVRDLVQVGRAR